MTQLEAARKGVITQQMIEVAEDEGLSPEEIRELVATGEVVIPHNQHHDFRAIGIGKRLRTKVNANIGASNFHQLIEEEVEKLYTAVRYGADSVMDLSTGTDLDKIRGRDSLALPGDPRHRADLPGRVRAFDHGSRRRRTSSK